MAWTGAARSVHEDEGVSDCIAQLPGKIIGKQEVTAMLILTPSITAIPTSQPEEQHH